MWNDPNSLPPAKSPFLTTAEAADYLRYRTPGGITMAVRRGWLSPDGRGPRGTFLFRRETLDSFAARRALEPRPRGTLDLGCRLVRGRKEDFDEHQIDECKEEATRHQTDRTEPVSRQDRDRKSVV